MTSNNDHLCRHNWRYPRTSRDAVGAEFTPLRKSLSFHTTGKGSTLWVIVTVVALVMAISIIGWTAT